MHRSIPLSLHSAAVRISKWIAPKRRLYDQKPAEDLTNPRVRSRDLVSSRVLPRRTFCSFAILRIQRKGWFPVLWYAKERSLRNDPLLQFRHDCGQV